MNGSLDIDYVRSRFPGLADGWAYFDNAGGSQVLDGVIERVAHYMATSPVQVGASYPVSELATRRQDDAAAAMAGFINARDPAEIIFGPSTTAMIGRLARALAPSLKPGDEIVVTNLDHEANITPWRRLAQQGIQLREWRVRPETFQLHVEDLAPLLNEHTRLVCFTQGSNVVGQLTPLAAATRLAHEHGAEVCIDGVACAAHGAIDVTACDVDYYTFSTYKVFGPHLAVLYGKRDKLLALANLNHEFFDRDALPYKLQPGGATHELVWGTTGVAAYYRDIGQRHGVAPDASLREHVQAAATAFAAHEHALAARLLDFLSSKPNVTIIGDTEAGPDRLPTIAFTVAGRDSATVPPQLDPHRIAIRYGHFYAKRLIDALGLAAQNGVVRVSMAHYNTLEEVDRLIERLQTIL
ncbi:MAG TPA: cysteine desulfurase-like protein [Gammaproteobacteria bacterium]|jgi:cysteine desulfurase family protein (TIGR01976 family)|nr:cysteine desulfurase-like protein [Gammaproteobacteria bacterium]